METLELKQLALKFVAKGYIDGDMVRYSDDLYDATADERDAVIDFIGEIIKKGRDQFEAEMTGS